MRKRRSLQREIDHLIKLYGGRNRLFLKSLSRRIIFLQISIKDLLEVVRQKRSQRCQEAAIARVFARLVCIIDYLHSDVHPFPFVEFLCKKYPNTGCSYCQKMPCSCKAFKRPNYSLENVANRAQVDWSIQDWQTHFQNVYGSVNQESSWENILNRLIAEVVEIFGVEFSTYGSQQDVLIANYAKEIGDTFAWTCALATRLNLSLDKSNEQSYGVCCWNCKVIPCKCDQFSYSFVDWDNFERKLKDGEVLANTIKA